MTESFTLITMTSTGKPTKREIKLAMVLTHPKKLIRDDNLQSLQDYLETLTHYKESELLNLWKALYYCFSLADKVSIQMELAERFSQFIYHFQTNELVIGYIQCFYRILLDQSPNIYHHFHLLIRLILSESIKYHYCYYQFNKIHQNHNNHQGILNQKQSKKKKRMMKKTSAWEEFPTFLDIVQLEVLTKAPNDVRFHICDIYLQELARVTQGKLDTDEFIIYIQPFIDALTSIEDSVYLDKVQKTILIKFLNKYSREAFKEKQETKTGAIEGEEHAYYFHDVNTNQIQKILFDLASSSETSDRFKKRLFDLHKTFAAKTAVPFITPPSKTIGSKRKFAEIDSQPETAFKNFKNWLMDAFSHQSNALFHKSLTFREVAPPQINGERIYERREQAEQIAQCLLESSGTRLTPLCDACFGAGKTSLIYKFRGLLDPSKFGPSFSRLKDAIYLHVSFSNPRLSHLKMDREDQEKYVVQIIYKTLKLSAGSSLLLEKEVHCLDDLLSLLVDISAEHSFLFHFDDVGAFEDLQVEDLPIKMLYVIWNIGEELRKLHHFYIMTGRSPYLHLVGCKKLGFPNYSSPNMCFLINLPPLTRFGIKKMIEEFKVCEKIDPDLFEWIVQYTAGVPRAVNALLVSIRLMRASVDRERLRVAVRNVCQAGLSLLTQEDEVIFRRCVEFSWCGIELHNNTVLHNEPITSVMARLGLFRGPTQSLDLFTIVVPQYLLDYYSNFPSVNSMMAISNQDNAGSRLECGFRRVLRLRFQLDPCSSWKDIGLSFLYSSNFPFPEAKMHSTYLFPKIGKDNSWSEKQVRRFMEAAHSRNPSVIRKSEFSAKALPSIYRYMKVGQYYQPLPLSSSADALLRCSENQLIVFQYKNLKDGFKFKNLTQEAIKCIAKGWQVYLVIICPNGHDYRDGEDFVLVDKNITIGLLSKDSISAFLGIDATKAIESISLVSDVMGRLKISAVKENNSSN